MLLSSIHAHRTIIKSLIPIIETIRRTLGGAGDLSTEQAIAWLAMAFDFQPTLILDLGTGSGNSAAIWAVVVAKRPACRVFTFDLTDRWSGAKARLSGIPNLEVDAVNQVAADITTIDFRELVNAQDRIIVLLDAHGFSITEHLLSHVMPIICDAPHIVICHDASDARYFPDIGYCERRLYHGLDDFYRDSEHRAVLRLGWVLTTVEQYIPLLDFCARNAIELRSGDHEYRTNADRWKAIDVERDFAFDAETYFHFTFFSMNETTTRDFPARPPTCSSA